MVEGCGPTPGSVCSVFLWVLCTADVDTWGQVSIVTSGYIRSHARCPEGLGISWAHNRLFQGVVQPEDGKREQDKTSTVEMIKSSNLRSN